MRTHTHRLKQSNNQALRILLESKILVSYLQQQQHNSTEIDSGLCVANLLRESIYALLTLSGKDVFN